MRVHIWQWQIQTANGTVFRGKQTKRPMSKCKKIELLQNQRTSATVKGDKINATLLKWLEEVARTYRCPHLGSVYALPAVRMAVMKMPWLLLLWSILQSGSVGPRGSCPQVALVRRRTYQSSSTSESTSFDVLLSYHWCILGRSSSLN